MHGGKRAGQDFAIHVFEDVGLLLGGSMHFYRGCINWVFAWLCASAAVAFPDESSPGRMCSTSKTGPVQCIRFGHQTHDICQTIQRTALHYKLDQHFLARLLWQESRFDRNAISPARAMGIAQFIRSTADLRNLKDPFNPADAIARSAEYLSELSQRYGNIGLAAVAYNGGEWRVEQFIKGGRLKRETIDYVRIITGRTAETWRDAPPKVVDLRLDQTLSFQAACETLAAGRRQTPLRLSPAIAPWGAQLAFGKTKKEAWARYRTRVLRCESVVRGERPDIIFVPNRVPGRKGYFMARIGRSTRDAANKLCNSARQAGCPCAVYRND